MKIEILGTGKAVPAALVTNADLAKKIDTDDEWIMSHTGIGSRYIAEPGTGCGVLALEAAREALLMAVERGEPGERKEKTPEELAGALDLIVVGTVTPDYNGCPATACIVQHGLGAKNAAAMDVGAGCSGFIYGLEAAAGLLAFKKERRLALVIGAETLSSVTDWEDRGSCVLFGDGAGAVLLEKTDRPEPATGKRGLLRTILRADGSGADHLIVRRGGSKNPFLTGEVVAKPPHIEMNGRAVYNFAVKAVTEIVEALLAEEGIGIDDVSRIVPHQANARIVCAAAKRLGIPKEKFFLNIETYANTSAASIPIALDELNRSGRIAAGDIIMTVGFGAGLTYGGNLIAF